MSMKDESPESEWLRRFGEFEERRNRSYSRRRDMSMKDESPESEWLRRFGEFEERRNRSYSRRRNKRMTACLLAGKAV